MGVETSVADKRRRELSKLAKGKDIASPPIPNPNPNPKVNSNSSGKKGRRRQNKKVVSPVQNLYNTCKKVFASGGPGIIPSSDKIEKLKAVLDGITAVDVGLDSAMPYFRTTVTGRKPVITYLHLFENEEFSMGIFCLPPSGVLPLHNHPGMTVFSKLLFGNMHIKSYDWVGDHRTSAVANPSEDSVKQSEVQQPEVKQSEVRQPEVRLAKVKVNSNHIAPCDTRILYPAEGGNMHCFTAVTACAVLDVLGPPYSDSDGRDCQYYLDFPFAKFLVDGVSVPEEEREDYAWLQEGDKPDDLHVAVQVYAGPKIVK